MLTVRLRHIISVLCILLLVLKGLSGFLPALPLPWNKSVKVDLAADMEKEGKENKEKAIESSIHEELFDSVSATSDLLSLGLLSQGMKHASNDLLPHPYLAPLTPPPNTGV